MKPTPPGRRATIAALSLFLSPLILGAQQQRPPAVPLITHDPYFSIWSMADNLTDKDTTHWTGHRQPIAGLARIDGKTYRFMGAEPARRSRDGADSPRCHAHAHHLQVPGRGVTLTVTFFTPAFPNDLDLLSRPVTYLTLTATRRGRHEVSVLIDVDPVIAVNTADEASDLGTLACVRWPHDRSERRLARSARLNRPGDDLRIDWGYFHLAVPDGPGAQFAATTNDAIRKLRRTGRAACGRRPRHAATCRANDAAHLAMAFAAWQACQRQPSPASCCSPTPRSSHRVSQPQAAPLLAAQWRNREANAGGRRDTISSARASAAKSSTAT